MPSDNGVEGVKVPMMTICVDPRTMAVTYKCDGAPIYFWQMVVTEVAKQLEEQRRAAVAINLQAALQKQREDQALFDRLSGKV